MPPGYEGRSSLAVLSLPILSLSLLLTTGCSSLGYYWQSVNGHMQMVNAARPVGDWLVDAQTPEPLKARLALSQRIRRFAVTDLALPDNRSYRSYADLHRRAVVWNVVAAPEFSLTLKTWCFPVVGCVGYRGYFNEAQARLEADQLRTEGLEASVYPVPAYSTLGLMNWAGGDPLLNTFINYPEGELARLIFHELSHQVVYVAGDTTFNESLATAVERLGSRLWLDHRADEAARREYATFDRRRQDFRALTLRTRRALTLIYGEKEASASADIQKLAIESEAKRVRKNAELQRFRDDYARLKAGWGGTGGGFSGYDPWVARANNASFGAQAAYDELVPGFEALFVREGSDWRRFYAAVKRLGKLPKEERHLALKADTAGKTAGK